MREFRCKITGLLSTLEAVIDDNDNIINRCRSCNMTTENPDWASHHEPVETKKHEDLEKLLDAELKKTRDALDSRLKVIDESLLTLREAVVAKENISEELKRLIEVNGKEAIITAFKTVVGSDKIKPQAGYTDFIDPANIADSRDAYVEGIGMLEVTNDAIKANYEKRAEIKKRIKNVENDKTAAEAIAMMSAPDTLKNKESRDAFRRKASSEERKTLAELNGELEYITDIIEGLKAVRDTQERLLSFTKASFGIIESIFRYLA